MKPSVPGMLAPLARFAVLPSHQDAERERAQLRRTALQREGALKEQIEAPKAIERGILALEDRRRALRR